MNWRRLLGIVGPEYRWPDDAMPPETPTAPGWLWVCLALIVLSVALIGLAGLFL